MPLSIPPGYAHVAIEFKHDLDPDPWYVTYGIDSSGLGGDFAAAGEFGASVFQTEWSSAMSQAVQITGTQVVAGQDGSESLRIFTASSVARRGTNNGNMLPQNCAALIRKYSAIGGRRNRGRCFIPAIADEVAVNAVGVIDPANVTDWQNRANNWLARLADGVAALGTGPTPMVILHSTGLSPIPDPTPVVSLGVDNVISTQRRRLR